MSDHVPSYARHDAGRSPPPRARPAPRGSRQDDRGHDRSGDRFNDRSPRGYDDRRRSRSEADWREPARLTGVGATRRRCPVGIRRRRDLARRLRIRQGVQAGFGPPALLPRLGGARRSIASLRAGDEVKFVAREPAPARAPATATARPTRWTSPRSPRRTARRTFSRGTCRGPSRARSAGAQGGRPAGPSPVARKHGRRRRRRRRIFEKGYPTLQMPVFRGRTWRIRVRACVRTTSSPSRWSSKFTGERRVADVTFVRHAERKPAAPAARKGAPGASSGDTSGGASDEPPAAAVSTGARQAGWISSRLRTGSSARSAGDSTTIRKSRSAGRGRGSPNESVFHYTALARDTRERT